MPLYLQEKTNIIGMHPNRGLFSKAMAAYAGSINNSSKPGPMRNLGIWEFVGVTGEWARVLGLYEFSDGWTSVTEVTEQIMRSPPDELAATYRLAEERRSGGHDEILQSLDGSPTYADIAEAGALAPLLIVDEARVEPGREEQYGEALLSAASPIAADADRRLIGLYKGALTDGLVLSYWVTSLEAYGLFNGSGRLKEWRAVGSDLRLSWREELWTAASS